MTVTHGLHRLARAYGVQTSYYDLRGDPVHASSEALLAVLAALGAPVRQPRDAGRALREHRLAQARCPLEPVTVAWDGTSAPLVLRVRTANAPAFVRQTLTLESGETHSCDLVPETAEPREVEGCRVLELRLPALRDVPAGYHELRLEAGELVATSHVLSAPTRADTRAVVGRTWGVFLPTFSLRDDGDLGCGDFSELGRLVEWTAERGGDAVATLPLLASFLGPVPFEPSPYAPASRLAWNDLYVDLAVEPEWPAASALVQAADFRTERQALGQLSYLEYERLERLRRPVLAAMAEQLFAAGGQRRAELEAFLDARKDRREYARFRAVVERREQPWPCWPEPLRSGELRDEDIDAAAFRRHAYGQFVAHGQLARLAARAQAAGVRIVLDLPLGVHTDSFDTWRHPELFAPGVSVGAPPDAFFTEGQGWGFPPPLPSAERTDGYRYLAATLRHHLEHADVLRVDHILGLHRLYWIPHGMGPKQGVYVRRPSEELYAVLCLESARAGVTILGEDLGTVPRGVRPAMSRHGLQRLHVLQFAAGGEPGPGRSPAASVASMNTHDLPTFAAFHDGRDIDDFLDLGLYDGASARSAREQRDGLMADLRTWLEGRGLLQPGSDRRTLLRACLAYLAESPAPLVLVNLEDLWLEERAVNVPGTHRERPNWRRRTAPTLSELMALPEVLDVLQDIAARRRQPVVRRRPGPATLPPEPTSRFSEMDVALLLSGEHRGLFERLGSRPVVSDGIAGVHFALWAPDAVAVSVFGSFDGWDSSRHPLTARTPAGLFEGFVPAARRGALYKYRVRMPDGREQDRPDPLALRSERAPGTASRVWSLEHDWGDGAWMSRPPDSRVPQLATLPARTGPLDGHQLFDELLSAVRRSETTAVVLPPLMDVREQDLLSGAFAPAAVPQDLMRLVDRLHGNGLGVWMPWPAPRPEWQRDVRHEGPWPGPVASLVTSSFSFWLEAYHLDGLQLDADGACHLAALLTAATGASLPAGTPSVTRAWLLERLDTLGHLHPRTRMMALGGVPLGV